MSKNNTILKAQKRLDVFFTLERRERNAIEVKEKELTERPYTWYTEGIGTKEIKRISVSIIKHNVRRKQSRVYSTRKL